MTNGEWRITKYFSTWWTIMARPIYFYVKLKEESWQDQPLTFLLISSWLLAAAMTTAIFIIQYVPIGSTLVEGIVGWKFIIILPVLVTLALVFFFLTLLILGGVLAAAAAAGFYLVAWLLHCTSTMMGGKGEIKAMAQKIYYSSAVLLAGVFPVGLAMVTRFGWLDFSLFRVGYNFIYFLTLLFVYGLWAVACRRNYQLTKGRAFVVSLLPIACLLLFGLAFDKMALSKIEAWITPLK